MVQDHTVKPGGPGNVVRSGVEEELKENLKQEKYFYTKIRSHQILTNTECVCEGKQNETDAPFSEQCSWSSRCSVVLHWYFTGTEHLSCGDTCFTLITAHIPEEKNIFCWVFFPTFCLFVSGHSSNHFIAVWLGVRVCEGGGGVVYKRVGATWTMCMRVPLYNSSYRPGSYGWGSLAAPFPPPPPHPSAAINGRLCLCKVSHSRLKGGN